MWHIVLASLHSQDVQVKRHKRFAPVERGDITPLLPWLMGYTRRASARHSDSAHEETDEAKFKRASSACRHPGEVPVATRSLLAELRAPGREATWERVKAKSPTKIKPLSPRQQRQRWKQALLIRRKGMAPSGARRKEFDPQIDLGVINSWNALSGAGSDGLCFFRSQVMIRTGFGREKFGAGNKAF